MNKNVLVFPCGSEIGLEIYRSLNFSTHFTLFGGSTVDDHGKFVYKNYIPDIPSVDDAGFMEKLNRVIEANQIDYILPAHDSVVLKLAQESAAGNLKCHVVTSPLETCEIARSKTRTYERLMATVKTPKAYDSPKSINQTDWPIFLKPEVGQGSKGTYLANNLAELDVYLQKDPNLILLEHLPGKEYTIECFTNSAGQLLLCKGRERIRVSNGISVNSKFVDNDRFKDFAEKINAELEFSGVWFFQLKEDKAGQLVLLEIAPRVSGTMALLRCKGINLVLLSLFDSMGQEVGIFENDYNLVIDRALENRYQHDINYEHVYLDFDDTVVFNGQINPNIMAFVFQCLNNGVKVHLITRHKDDLNVTLKGHKLDGIFDELVWLQNNEEKSAHISEVNSIFIDDSFTERKKVHDKLGIPVFDSHTIESLMEKF